MSHLEYSIEFKDWYYLLRSTNDETLSYIPDSPEWFEWLGGLKAFRFVGKQGTFTARCENIVDSKGKKHGTSYWYGHRKLKGVHVKRYLSKTSNDFSITFLEESAKSIEESLKQKLGVGDGESLPGAGAQNVKTRVAEQEQEIASLHCQIETQQAYVATLEGQLRTIEARHEKRVAPKQEESAPDGFVWLRDFCHQHFVPYAEAERLFSIGMIHGQKITINKRRAPIAIGQKGQHDFYVQLRTRPDFRTCDDCPHIFDDIKQEARK